MGLLYARYEFSIVSKYPYSDICCVVYLGIVFGTVEIGMSATMHEVHSNGCAAGWNFFWVCCTNLVAAFGELEPPHRAPSLKQCQCICMCLLYVILVRNMSVLRRVLEAKRPVEFDSRLQPLADVHADSYGFPSIESHMSVCVFGLIASHFQNILIPCACICLVLLVGASRVCARSR
jgi:membrane-associated phospholipid phosphatase